MTEIETKIRKIFDAFCDQNGGGERDIEILPGQFGGYSVTLAWDGFDRLGLGGRHKGVFDLLVRDMGPKVFHIVRTIHLVTFAEKLEEEATADAGPSDRPWHRR